MRLPPRSEALAYRIWAYANPLGWDCTLSELSEALDAKFASVRVVVSMKGWAGRIRSTGLDFKATKAGAYSGSLDGAYEAAKKAIRELHLEGASE